MMGRPKKIDPVVLAADVARLWNVQTQTVHKRAEAAFGLRPVGRSLEGSQLYRWSDVLRATKVRHRRAKEARHVTPARPIDETKKIEKEIYARAEKYAKFYCGKIERLEEVE